MLPWSLLVILAPISMQADGLTLLAPSSVFEGDRLVLTCQKKNNWKIRAMTYYKDERVIFNSQKDSSFLIQSAVLSDSGKYYCTVRGFWGNTYSEKIKINVQELFLHPVLIASSLQPTEGGPVTLTCKTWLPPQKSHVQLQVRFFRDSQALGSGWSSSPKFQISAVRPEDSGFYWCEASTVSHRIRKQSFQFKIHVQRIPIFNVNLETQTPGGEVIEGGKLLLLCSVAEGTGNITFFWYRANIETNLGRKTRGSLSAELEIPVVKESDSGEYYCEADNGYGPTRSKVVDILVRIPVSRPGFILRTSEAQLVAGDVVELHCEALRGSPPILYRFYFENVTLGNRSAPSGGGASFNLSLTAEHSGNYSCEADNGLGAQQSEVVTLSVSGPEGYGRNFVTVRVLGGLLGILGVISAALLFYCWSHKTLGESFATNAPRGSAPMSSQELTHSSSIPDTAELQPEYVNVSPVCEDVLYSDVWSIQLSESSANIRRTFMKNEEFQVIYSPVKKP